MKLAITYTREELSQLLINNARKNLLLETCIPHIDESATEVTAGYQYLPDQVTISFETSAKPEAV